MSSVNHRADEMLDAAPVDHVSFYKEDRPRRIDLTIDFFGDDQDDTCGEQLLDALTGESSER
jgi:hypothetical protein